MSVYVLFQNLKESPPSNPLRFSPLFKRAYTWTYDKISYVFYTKMLTIGNWHHVSTFWRAVLPSELFEGGEMIWV